MPEDPDLYKVVINHEEQYSLWPIDRDNPPGWRDAGTRVAGPWVGWLVTNPYRPFGGRADCVYEASTSACSGRHESVTADPTPGRELSVASSVFCVTAIMRAPGAISTT